MWSPGGSVTLIQGLTPRWSGWSLGRGSVLALVGCLTKSSIPTHLFPITHPLVVTIKPSPDLAELLRSWHTVHKHSQILQKRSYEPVGYLVGHWRQVVSV